MKIPELKIAQNVEAGAALLQKSVMQDELITDMAKKWGGFAPNVASELQSPPSGA